MNDSLGSHRAVLVLLLSGSVGFFLGMFEYPCWQAAVESAQVVAGIIHYPSGNSFYIYHTKLWTLLHQIPALLLRLGFSEMTLSLLMSGVTGMVAFQALALSVLALSDDCLVAVLSPLIIFHSGATSAGLTYGIPVMASSNTHGTLGSLWVLLVVALFARGQFKLGGLLLGIAPAIHPVLGLWCSLIVWTSFLWGYRQLRDSFREAIPYIFLGYSVSAASLVLHLLFTYDVPKVDPKVTSSHLWAFVRYWDDHRQPFPLFSHSILAILFTLFMSVFWLFISKRDLPRNSHFLLRSFIVSALIGGGLSSVHWLPPEKIPPLLLILMPARLPEFNILGFSPLLLGLLARYKAYPWIGFNLITLMVTMYFFLSPPFVFFAMFLSSALLLGSVIYLRRGEDKTERLLRPALIFQSLLFILCGFSLLSFKSQNPLFFGKYSLVKLVAVSFLGLMGTTLFFSSFFATTHRVIGIKSTLRKLSLSHVFHKVTWMRMILLVIVGTMVVREAAFYFVPALKSEPLLDRTNEPLFAEISRGEGLLLTGPDMTFIQLRGRRPLLLDTGSLDILPYALEAAPEANRILKQVYGIDILDPPEEAKRNRIGGAVPEDPTRGVWELRTPEAWKEIKKEFKVTQVMTHAGWRLQLPEIIRNHEFVLYEIP